MPVRLALAVSVIVLPVADRRIRFRSRSPRGCTAGATPHFDYFDCYRANPAARARTYYNFDLEDWHVVSLNAHHGVLFLILSPRSYEWAFLTTDGTIGDRSEAAEACHE